ncbi:MAG TPA: two-component regulator propeller domain-containing protein [Candidatus Acidoferrum sp.]|nr:two-component regulator propeller domain-containing protein [Candidatus Acidoferrum sp.]
MGRNRNLPSWAIIGAALAAIALAGVFVGWRATRALHQSTQEVRSEREIRFLVRPFLPPSNVKFEVVSSPDVLLQAARFQNHLFIAGPSGLSEYDPGGTLLRQFVAGKELPSSPLVALAVGTFEDSTEPELVLATAGEGILLFNGKSFRQIYPADAEVRSVTAILPVAAGHLLIGTKRRGVLLYDGKQIRELHPTLNNLYVQVLAGNEVDLWIGTLNQGVLHWHAGTSEPFGEEQGLPDRQVQAIALAGDKSYVGTPVGVAEFDRGRFSRVLGEGLLVTSLFVSGEELFVGTEDQGVVRVPLTKRRPGLNAQGSTKLAEVRQFLGADSGVYVLTRNGVYELPEHGFGWKEVLKPRPSVLSDRNISALAEDKNGQLWVGYFDRGLDLLPGDSRRVLHVENEHVFCVNRIWPDAKSGTVAVATANGLVRMGASGSQEQVLTRADGLIADHVTDVVPYGEGLAIATPAGLTFLDATGARSMYAFHGLVNNHVYALGVSGDDLMVGTLGGLSVIGRGAVRVNYTAGASGLKQNWITAVVPMGDEWMVGTYGSGIMGLDRAGHFRAFEKATAEMEINPNAMLVTPQYVLAGTLGNGLYVYDREKSRWAVIHEGLPSQNVTALAQSKGYIYVGTDNGLVRIQEQKLQP